MDSRVADVGVARVRPQAAACERPLERMPMDAGTNGRVQCGT